MDPALKLQAGVDPFPLDSKGDLLHAAQLRLVDAVDLSFPPAGLGVHGVHAVQGVGEQGGLLAPHPGPDLHDDVFPVVGVLGEKQNLQLLFQPLQVGLGLVELLLGQLLHLRVGQEGLGFLLLRLGPQVLPVGLHHRGELVLLLVQLGHLGGIVVGLRSGQAGLDLTVFGLNGRQLVQHRSVPFL